MHITPSKRNAIYFCVALFVGVAILTSAARATFAEESYDSPELRRMYEEHRKAGLQSDVEKLVLGTEQQVAEVIAKIEPRGPGVDPDLVATLFGFFRYPQGDVEPWRERAILTYLVCNAPEEPVVIEYLVRRIDFHWPLTTGFLRDPRTSPQWPVANYPAAVSLEYRIGARAGPVIFAHLAGTPPENVTDKQMELFAYVLRDLYGGLGYDTLEAVVQTAKMDDNAGAKENRRRLLEAVRKTQEDLKRWPPPQIP